MEDTRRSQQVLLAEQLRGSPLPELPLPSCSAGPGRAGGGRGKAGTDSWEAARPPRTLPWATRPQCTLAKWLPSGWQAPTACAWAARAPLSPSRVTPRTTLRCQTPLQWVGAPATPSRSGCRACAHTGGRSRHARAPGCAAAPGAAGVARPGSLRPHRQLRPRSLWLQRLPSPPR